VNGYVPKNGLELGKSNKKSAGLRVQERDSQRKNVQDRLISVFSEAVGSRELCSFWCYIRFVAERESRM